MTNTSTPPRFVPTLTEVVNLAESVKEPPINTIALENQLVRRVMGRVDLSLDPLLRDAVDRVIADHIQALRSRLHAEIELAVRSSVSQALEQELG